MNAPSTLHPTAAEAAPAVVPPSPRPSPRRGSFIDHWAFEEYDLPPRSLGIFRILFALAVLVLALPRWVWMASFNDGFFNPPIGLASFVSGFPPAGVFYALNFAAIACAIFLLFGKYVRVASLGLALCWWVGNSFDYAFGKINHDVLIVLIPLLMTFSAWGDAYSLDGPGRAAAATPHRRDDGAWPLAMLALLIGCGMTFATLQKLAGGWLDPHRHAVLQYLLVNYYQVGRQNPVATAALRHTPMWLWKMQDLMTIALEGSFLLSVVRLRAFRVVIAVACFFHFAIAVLFEISFWPNLVAYAAFVNWTFLDRWPSFQRLRHAVAPAAAKARPWHLLAVSAALFGLYMAGVNVLALAGRVADEPAFVLGLIVCPISVIVAVAYFLTFFERGRDIRNAAGPSAATADLLGRGRPVILFDGVCGLCSAWVDFVIARDRRRRFLFTPLQSDAGQAVLADYGLPVDYLASVLLLDDGKIYASSEAVLRIFKKLGPLFAPMYAFMAVPPFVRDGVYRFIARNRYRWFGKKETCRLPTPEERVRFV